MSKLNKVLLIILILQYSKATPCLSNWYSDEYDISDCDIFPAQECPEGQSLISNNDLTALLNYVVKRSHVVEDIIESYHDKYVALTDKHLDQLNEFQESAEDKKEHLKHILEGIEDLHQTLEPIGQGIVAEIDKIDASGEHLAVVVNNLEKLLKRFQLFQELCEINDKSQEPINALKQNLVFKPSKANLDSLSICESIEVIYAEAMKQLHDFRDEYIAGVESVELEIDDHLKDLVISYNNRLKDAALIQNNHLMYDILKLQDGYFHLNQYYTNFNLSSKLNDIENNVHEVESMLEVIENDVYEYGKMCMGLRIQRGAPGISFKGDYYPEIKPTSSEIIDAAISIKIAEIEDIILRNNFTGIFKELEERLFNHVVFESYLQKLAPRDEDVESVTKATEKMNELKNLIPQSTFKKLQDLYGKSDQVKLKAEKAKEEIEAKIKYIHI